MFNFFSSNYNAGVNKGSSNPNKNTIQQQHKIKNGNNNNHNIKPIVPKPKPINIKEQKRKQYLKWIEELKKESHYPNTALCAVWIDWNAMYNDQDKKIDDSNNSNISIINDDILKPIPKTNTNNINCSVMSILL